MTKPAQLNQTSTTTTPFPWMTAPSGFGLEAFTRIGEACNKARAWQEEIVRFMNARAQTDTQVAQKLVACRNWADAVKLQQDWAASMTQDYFDEANRLARLASTFGTDLAGRSSAGLRPAA